MLFRSGDEVKIRVSNVNIEESAIDFEIVDMIESASNRPRKIAPKVITAGRRESSRRGERSERRDRRSSSSSKSGRGERDRGGKRSSSSSDRDPRGRRKDGKEKPKFYEGIAKKKRKK